MVVEPTQQGVAEVHGASRTDNVSPHVCANWDLIRLYSWTIPFAGRAQRCMCRVCGKRHEGDVNGAVIWPNPMRNK